VAFFGVVQVGMQWSKGNLWPVREQAEGASSVGEVERNDEVDKKGWSELKSKA